MSGTITMRAPCKHCGNDTGTINNVNGQNVVRCSDCGRACYNAPKTETGDAPRKPMQRDNINPGTRARVFERDGARCVICGQDSKDSVFHIAHIISVKDIKGIKGKYGIDLTRYEKDMRNLFVCCEACNLGQAERSAIPKLAVMISCIINKEAE